MNDNELIEAYRFHGPLHLLRFIAYSYEQTTSDYAKALFKMLLHGNFKSPLAFLRKKLKKSTPHVNVPGQNGHRSGRVKQYTPIAQFLIEKVSRDPVVVDYGCGVGYISFEIALLKKAKVYLVDIDCITLQFAEYRFKKHGIDVEVIPVSHADLYPRLPAHNICIATEVMEHVKRPLTVFDNINAGLEAGGLLYGDFEDHEDEMFHVHPKLDDVRDTLKKDFQKISNLCYQKKSKGPPQT